MRFLVAGLGSIGRRHLRNLLTLGERDIVLLRTFRSTLPDEELAGFPVETELQAALAHKPDGVIVANPTAHHLDVAIPAAAAGCHLLIEKPLSHSLEQVDELRIQAARSGARILMGYHFRFHPSLIKIADLLTEGAIGRPLSVRAHWGEYLPDWHPWEDYRQGYSARAEMGGGVVLTLSHPVDYLRWLFGEVSELWAFIGQLGDLQLDVEDTAEIGLRFQNGMLGSLHVDYNQRPPAHWLEVIGSQGTLQWDNTSGDVEYFQTSHPEDWQRSSLPIGFERNHLFLTEMEHFIKVVKAEAAPCCSLEDGVQALKISLAALQVGKSSSYRFSL